VNAIRRRAPDWARSDVLLPLLAAYFAFSAYYVWQAWRRETPSIFTDELELTQISRAIAHTGHPARRGVPYPFTSLYPYFTAPAWWLHATQEAFDTIKYLGVLAMTAALFPAYGIARAVLSQRWAVAAAVGAVAAPALSYSPILVEEPLAYLASTVALWLIVRATLRPSGRSIVLAFAAAVVAAGVRSQLGVLVAVLLISLSVVGWQTERMRAWRTAWSSWDWIGAIALFAGALIVVNAIASRRSQEWEIVTRLYKDRMWTLGAWAAGGLAVGLGVLPLVGGLASLVRPRGRSRDPARTAFTIVTASALVTFSWYTAIKGAYLSTVFSTVIVERNLIYLDPILFTGTALVLAGRGTRWWWALASGSFGIYLVAHLRYGTAVQFPYYEGHGLAITALANRIFHWPVDTIRDVGAAIAVAATGIVLLVRYLPVRGRAAGASIAAICAAVLVWNVTAETYAAQGEYHLSHNLARNFIRPFDWVDRATGRRSTVLLGQQFGDANGIWLTEFWNSSIQHVWSVDPSDPRGHAPGPGPTLTPDLASVDGTLVQSPHTQFALAINGVELQAPVVATAPQGVGQTVYELDGGPIKLATSQTGVEGDGWLTSPNSEAPAFSAYNRFDAASAGNAIVVAKLSRIGYAGHDVPGHVTVRLGTLVIGPDKQPALGRVLKTSSVTIHACGRPNVVCSTGIAFKNPGVPFRIEVTVTPTFSPHDYDPTADARHLGVQLSYSFNRL
jgi:hypothetical protein